MATGSVADLVSTFAERLALAAKMAEPYYGETGDAHGLAAAILLLRDDFEETADAIMQHEIRRAPAAGVPA